MRTTVRRVAAAPILLAAGPLAGCTGASTGSPDPGAAGRAGQQAQDFAVGNGHLIASIIVAAAGAAFLAFLWRSQQMRILGALLIGGAVAYYAMGGGR